MLNNIIKYIVIPMILLCLVACQTDFPVNAMPERFDLSIRHDESIGERGEVKTTNEMVNFFEKEKAGWSKQYIPITFFPNYSLKSKQLDISILSTRIYIRFSEGESKDMKYYYKDINTEQLMSIIEKNKITTTIPKEQSCCIVK